MRMVAPTDRAELMTFFVPWTLTLAESGSKEGCRSKKRMLAAALKTVSCGSGPEVPMSGQGVLKAASTASASAMST